MSPDPSPVPATDFRPRTAAELVDVSIQLVRRHYAQFLALSALSWLPMLVASVVGTLVAPNDNSVRDVLVRMLITLVAVAWLWIGEAGMVVASAEAYRGQAVRPAPALRAALALAGPLLRANIVKGILTYGVPVLVFVFAVLVFGALGGAAIAAAGAIGAVAAAILILGSVAIALVVMLRMFARLFAIPATVVLEKLRGEKAIARSIELARGQHRKILITLGLGLLIYLTVSLTLNESLVLVTGNAWLGSLLAQGITMLAYPALPALAALLYYDLRMRKEGLDIELAADRLGGAAVSQPAS